jgi:hypothetical protein
MGGTYAHLIKGIVETSYQYMKESNSIQGDCRNQHRECSLWAAAGHCLTNPGLMQVKCSPACQSCDKVDFHSRCAFTEDENIWKFGDVRRVMEKLLKDYPHYEPKSVGRRRTNPPHVVVLENFVTENESKRLLEQNQWEYEYVEREVEQDVFERVVNENRTYSFAVCGEVCEQQHQDVLLSLLERIEQVTGIPNENSEYMELRRYKQGQQRTNKASLLDHDYQEFELHHPQGVRIATMHMFLSDDRNDGSGSLLIPSLNATIEPKFGRAVFWPNVLDSNPDAMDPTMQYSMMEEPHALLMTQGTQYYYSATVYFHQRNYKHAEKWACHEPQNDMLQKKDRVLAC